MGKFFKKIWHIRWTCPKWANVLQVLGNQIDRGTVIDFHVSNTASTVATGKIWWAKPTQTVHQDPKLKYQNYQLVEFCQFVQCQGIYRETKNSH